jgi:two-component system CheB/CheR fusion protein
MILIWQNLLQFSILQAISALLEHIPEYLGIAYVTIQHLSPDHKSLLPELLNRKTIMPVHTVSK